jgi:hypothetical protein
MPDSLRRPHFAHPPFVEVVCGVQFEGLNNGELRTMDNSEPSFAMRTRRQKTTRRLRGFGLTCRRHSILKWSSLPPLRRVFFISPPGNFLIQLQPNRLLHKRGKSPTATNIPV